MKKLVIVTGAAGFVGSHLSDRLLERGWRVIGIDDFSSGKKVNLRQAFKSARYRLVKFDLSREKKVPLRFRSADWLVHLAAKKIPRYGGRLATLRTNLLATLNSLELARKLSAGFIFASSSDVYGLAEDLPFKEEGTVAFGPPTVARWSYGASKYLGEQLAFGYREEFKMPIVILRIFGVYGPRQVEGWKGNAVSAFFQPAITGQVYELHGDGRQTRSFVYIDDLISALVAAVESDELDGQVINLGSREEISMKKLAHQIHRLVRPGKKFKTKLVDYRSFTGREYQDVYAKLPDLTLAERWLNWSPSVGLEEGLERTWRWYQARK